MVVVVVVVVVVAVVLGILPGHGRMINLETIPQKNAAISHAADTFFDEDESIGQYAMGYY